MWQIVKMKEKKVLEDAEKRRCLSWQCEEKQKDLRPVSGIFEGLKSRLHPLFDLFQQRVACYQGEEDYPCNDRR
jgi:hypothetical protein